MLSSVLIRNFKSIRSVEFAARRVNLFIGEPNTGKSNVLEALGLLCPPAYYDLNALLRFRATADLFFEQRIAAPVEVRAGDWCARLQLHGRPASFDLFLADHESLLPGASEPEGRGWLPKAGHAAVIPFDRAKPIGGSTSGGFALPEGTPASPVRYYRFRSEESHDEDVPPDELSVPYGDNLFAVIDASESLRREIGDLFKAQGFRLQLRPATAELLLAKDVGDAIYSYPWAAASETLRRLAFLLAVLATNRGATLLLDEPEAHTFPFYTKQIAERIARDESNQFFLTTHNPYLLSSLVQKTAPDQLRVFVTRLERGETRLSEVPAHRLGELLELDVDAFFNLERLVEP